MNIKNVSIHICQILVIGLALTACTLDSLDTGIKPLQTEQRLDAYPVNFDCAVAGYDDEGKTRALSHDWKNNTSIFARFKSGSTYYLGFMTYENNEWQLISTDDFLEQTASGTVELYYFQESNGDYYYLNLDTQCLDIYNNGSLVRSTSLAWNSDSLTFSEATAVYLDRSATYNHAANGGGFSVKASLVPGLWRMRFSGTNGTTITLPTDENEIAYLSTFKWSKTEDISFSGGTKDITLTVTNGYTPYIYGEFVNTSTNKITVKNGSDTFTRNLSATNLSAGKSGCLTLPTSSNYSSTGWTRIASESPMTLKDMLEKPLGSVNIDLRTSTYQTVRDEVAKSYTITDYISTYDGEPWFDLRVDNNEACRNLTYQGLPFRSFNVFYSDDHISFWYYFNIEKSKASNNYTNFLNKIIQDFKNLNISLNKASDMTDYLAWYLGDDAAKNYYYVYVDESGTNNDQYEFRISVSYYNSELSMTLKDMLSRPFGTVNLDFSTATYSKIKTILSSMYTFEEKTESNGTGLHYFYINRTSNPGLEKISFLGKPLSSLCIRESENGFYVEYNFYIDKSDMPNPYSYLDQITQEFNKINIPMTYQLDPYDWSTECLASGYYNTGGYTAGGRSYWVYLYSRATYYFEIGTAYNVK